MDFVKNVLLQKEFWGGNANDPGMADDNSGFGFEFP
jgi:hypothetical protein